MTDVFVVGALHLDVVVTASRLPMLDETLFGEGVAYRFGGKGGNQALAAARMGAATAMAGQVGDDAFAGIVLAELDRSGVDRSQVLQTAGATGMSVAIVEAGGDYGAVVVSGVNRQIDPQRVDPGDAAVVVLQNELPEEVNSAVLRTLRRGATLILNAAPARTLSADLLSRVDILVVNRVEAAQMTDLDDGDLKLEDAARALRARGPECVIVTGGAAGAVIFDGVSLDWVRPPREAKGSSHGAGDAFVGALAAEIAAGGSIGDAARFAAAAAAHFVATPADERAAIRRADVDAWMAAGD